MGKTINFQEKRAEFLKQNKVDIEVPSFMQNTAREVYRGKKEQRKRLQRNKTKKRAKLMKKIATLGLVGVLAFGGYKAYQTYQGANSSITLEEALNNGETLENLKIDTSIKNELESIKNELSQNEMTNQELLQLSTKINELQFDTLKTKLAKTLNVNEEDIKLYTDVVSNQTGETHESVEIKDGQIYNEKGLFDNSNTISSDITNYIKDIGEMQTLMGKMQTGDLDRNSIMKSYKSAINEIDQMAAAKMYIDGKGNISIQKENKKSLEKQENKDNIKEDNQISDDELGLE